MDLEANKSRIEFAEPWRAYRKGYPQLSAFIAYDPDRTTTIYRRFERLTAQTLLYMESEIAELEVELDELNDAKVNSKIITSTDQDVDEEQAAKLDLLTGIQAGAESWKELKYQAYDQDGVPGLREHAVKKLELMSRISLKLKEYCKTSPDCEIQN